jgi:hypothetical protein
MGAATVTGLFGAQQRQRVYRLIDATLEPHGQLDVVYDSLDEAIAEAISWLQLHGVDPLLSLIGVEVSTASGDWRTLRLPSALLCPLSA